jgi:hypothetical protein
VGFSAACSADPWAAAEIKPVWRLMREELLRSTKLFVDETTAPVLAERAVEAVGPNMRAADCVDQLCGNAAEGPEGIV